MRSPVVERIASGVRRAPNAWILSTLGGALAIATTVAFGLLRLAFATNSLDALASEAKSQIVTLPFFATCAFGGFVVLGWALGCEFDRLKSAAATDALTVVANRRAFEERFELEFARSRESRMPLALMVIDLDELKSINDRFGHSEGDAALRAVARGIARSCRARDIVARWGGDEFVVLMARTRAVEALVVSERIHRTLAAAGVTVSIGVAEAEPGETSRAAALFQAADRALLRAKQRGRNRTVLAESSDRSDAIILDDPDEAANDASGAHAIRASGRFVKMKSAS